MVIASEWQPSLCGHSQLWLTIRLIRGGKRRESHDAVSGDAGCWVVFPASSDLRECGFLVPQLYGPQLINHGPESI